MDELLTQFLIEGRELVAEAEADLVRLASQPNDRAALDGAFRAIHTLKGSVGLFDMGSIERLLHAAEDALAAARRDGSSLDVSVLEALVGSVDETDRAIDELERDGRLSPDAGARVERWLARLGANATNDTGGTDGAQRVGETGFPPWATALGTRARAASVELGDQSLTAFRYTPDADCFFRGDDPLGVAAAVPDLIHLDLLPVATVASLDGYEPFACVTILEGLSRAPLDTVRQAFRLVPDQINLVTLDIISDEQGYMTAGAVRGGRTVRVDGARLDTLANEVGELVVTANALAHAARQAERADPALAAVLRGVQADLDRLSGRLHQSVSQLRRVPLAPSLRRLPRLVRDIAASVGKPVTFALHGHATEVDKQIADAIFEPLLHLIRNALDHGLEDGPTRAAVGKLAEGQLTITITRAGDEVVITVSDDGAGMDPDRIRARAVARGMIPAEEADELSDSQALRLILAPGFSTAATVTEISGRGVGMDAVQSAIERLQGRIEISSVLGSGSRFALHIPLDAITTKLLIVRAGRDRYGVPLDQIVETARIAAADIHAVGQGRACVLRERTVPLFDLSGLLGVEALGGDVARLVVTEAAGEAVALRVDGFESRIDALVRDGQGLLGVLPGVAGTALLGDGTVLLVLDLPELVG
ncbi:chemotaxis protein CheA [Sphingomonas sp. AP4-R1]|nr:chemotaxis protein CheA [Sphingomonas sp. AP4-R1]QJU60775.1 chemotaxis protein CheA [Sphingomonas sp. AP4-R1]